MSVSLALSAGTAFAASYPSPAHDFGPVAGANPLYNAANASTARPLLVTLVTFTDIAAPAGFTEAAEAVRVFGPAFPNLAGYYAATSFGRMGFSPAAETCGSTNNGVVSVNVGNSVAWTTAADPVAARTVLDAVNALGCVNFALFDTNGDGTLTDNEVGFLLIDATTRTCGATRGITPGAVYNGKSLAGSKQMSFSASGANIITLAHEVGHQTLGARDLYGFGVGSFDLFGPTCGAPDTTMFEFNAWQKLHLGWLTPTVVTKDGYYSVPRADTNAAAFLLYDPDRGTNDYFLVENREPSAGTYDQNATDKGLAIWRADDAQYASGSDTVRPIDIMRTDGATTAGCAPSGGCYSGANGDAWDPSDPATPQRTMARTWRDGAAANVAVRAVNDSAATVRVFFDVRGPGVLVDTYALRHAAATTITLGDPRAVSFPVRNTGEATDTFDFTVTGLPSDWTASTDTQTLGAGVDGTATVTVTPTLTTPAGNYTLTAVGTSATDGSVSSTDTIPVTVVRRASVIAYTGDLAAGYHDTATLRAVLTDAATGAPLAGMPVVFTVGTQSVVATTAADGAATATLTMTQTPGPVAVQASFAGDPTYKQSTSPSTGFTIDREETTTAYTGPTVILAGSSGVTLTARLLEDGVVAPNPAGQTLTLSLGGQSCSATVDSTGAASCLLTFSGALGPQPITATFAGDTYYQPSASSAATATVFAFPSRGAFTVGDGSAAAGAGATWWGAQWASANIVSGGGAPAAFKGFASTVTLATSTPPSVCRSAWTTDPGNSASPPGDVPSYMGVLVTSSVSKSGSTIGGSTVHIVVVRTDPGYAASPGQAGTGTVVATYC